MKLTGLLAVAAVLGIAVLVAPVLTWAFTAFQHIAAVAR